MLASTERRPSRPVIVLKLAGSSESRLKLTRCRPAWRKARPFCGNRKPLVVMARSVTPRISASLATSVSMPCRTSGSPPVRRTFWIPNSTAIRTTRSISSKLKICERGFHSRVMGVAGDGFLNASDLAAKVAAIGDTHPEVAHDATVRISQQVRLNHLGGTAVLVAGELVAGEAIFAPPDCLISTFRS